MNNQEQDKILLKYEVPELIELYVGPEIVAGKSGDGMDEETEDELDE